MHNIGGYWGQVIFGAITTQATPRPATVGPVRFELVFVWRFVCACLCISVSLCVCVSSEILLDILPTIQTPDVAKVLIELIRDETIRGIRSRLSIAAMSLTVKPTPEVVKKLMVSVT